MSAPPGVASRLHGLGEEFRALERPDRHRHEKRQVRSRLCDRPSPSRAEVGASRSLRLRYRLEFADDDRHEAEGYSDGEGEAVSGPGGSSAQMPKRSQDILDAMDGLPLAGHGGEEGDDRHKERVRANIMSTMRALLAVNAKGPNETMARETSPGQGNKACKIAVNSRSEETRGLTPLRRKSGRTPAARPIKRAATNGRRARVRAEAMPDAMRAMSQRYLVDVTRWTVTSAPASTGQSRRCGKTLSPSRGHPGANRSGEPDQLERPLSKIETASLELDRYLAGERPPHSPGGIEEVVKDLCRLAESGDSRLDRRRRRSQLSRPLPCESRAHASMEEAARADFVAVFDRGTIAAFGEPAKVFYDLFDSAWGMRRPFACEVAIELEARGFDLGERPLELVRLAAAICAGVPA